MKQLDIERHISLDIDRAGGVSQLLKLFKPSSYEEAANCLSHGIGFLLALAILPFFTQQLANQPGNHLGAMIFLIAMVFVYLASTLYHAAPEGNIKRFFLKLDYSIIFIFIAASYTAFADSVLLARPLTSIGIWSMAICGMLLKLANRLSHPLHSPGYYLLFGWITLISALMLATYLSESCTSWLLLGGGLYSIGVIFYLTGSKLRFSHLGWHVFVMLGNACHCIALFYR